MPIRGNRSGGSSIKLSALPPPGVADPDRVMRLVVRSHGGNGPHYSDDLTGLDYGTFASRATTVSSVAGWINITLSMGRGDSARSVTTSVASASIFPTLGVRPLLGRFYLESEDVEGSTDAPCVVSYRFWQRDLNRTPNVLGRRLLVGTVRYTIVGVTPEGFNGADLSAIDMWLPLHVAAPEFQGHDPELWTTDHSSWLQMVARLKPGVSLATATAEADHLYHTSGVRVRDKELKGTMLWDALQPGRSSLPNPTAKIAIWLSAGGLLLVLLVAANLVNLFVARTASRLALGDRRAVDDDQCVARGSGGASARRGSAHNVDQSPDGGRPAHARHGAGRDLRRAPHRRRGVRDESSARVGRRLWF